MKFRDALEELKLNIINLAYEYKEKSEFPIYLNEKSGAWKTSNGRHWMEGFLIGTLWNLYDFFRDEKIKELAVEYTLKLLKIEAPGVFSCSHLIRYIIVKLYHSFSNIQYSLK